MMRQLQKLSLLLLVMAGVAASAGATPPQENISVSVSRARVARGERVEITLQVSSDGAPSHAPVKAVVLRPSAGAEALPLRAAINRTGAYRAEVAFGEDAPANRVGAYACLALGALAPAGFLLLEKSRETLPGWLTFVTDVNVAGLLSFLLAAAGMIVGSLLTQSISRPIRLDQQEGL